MPPKRSRVAPRPRVCNCEVRCHGYKRVSQSTFKRHRRYREKLRTLDLDASDHSGSGSESDTEMSHASSSAASSRSTSSRSTSRSTSRSVSRVSSSPFKKRRLQSPDPDPFDDLLDQANPDMSDDSGRASPTISDSGSIDPGSLADSPPEDSDSSDESEPEADRDPDPTAKVKELKTALMFIEAVKNASLDNGDLDEDALHRLRNPSREPVDVSDPAERYSLALFLATTHGSEQQYNDLRDAYLERHPENEVLSLAQIKRKVAEWSGVVPIESHMCREGCVAYTGPYADLAACPTCSLPRVDMTGSAQRFYTIPLGPQLQALFSTPDSAKKMHYRREKTAEILASRDAQGNIEIPTYTELFHGADYLQAVIDGHIKDEDIVIIGSTDGAQLYRNKHSDCWISIWIVAEQGPKDCYKVCGISNPILFNTEIRFEVRAVLPDSIFPGPHKPKHMDSFKLPSVHHLAAIQKEGLRIWDALDRKEVISRPFLLMETADALGMTTLNGLVGHHGFHGCRLYCAMKGRHKDRKPHYYPVMKCPDNYTIPGCSHPDVDPESLGPPSEELYDANLKTLLSSRNETDFKEQRKATGICKPSLFSGIARSRRLGIPGMFPGDIMHWGGINWTDLVLSLFRGTMRCEPPDSKAAWDWAVLKGDVWKKHGQAVADATPYLPGSFDRPPRNPAEKISSGYKACEFQLYVHGLAPALFLDIGLAEKYWQHFCKGVSVIRCFQQYNIPTSQLIASHDRALEYVDEFETLFYQRKESRIHFVRQSVHNMTHLGPETVRVGPPGLYAQWTIERTIGNLGQEIKSHSQPYANLSERGLRRSQVNALKAMIPGLDRAEKKGLPRGSIDLGAGFVLLRARDEHQHYIDGKAGQVIRDHLEGAGKGRVRGNLAAIRWARLRLPNGQIARSAWKEKRKPLHKVRMARNVKTLIDGKYEIGEVQFYLRASIHKKISAFALIDFYSQPSPDLLRRSFNTLWSCTFEPESDLRLVPVESILSVVAMVPHQVAGQSRYFLVEKPGLDTIWEEEEDTEDAAYSTLASAIPQIFHYIPNPMQIPIPSSSAAGSTSTNPAVNPLTTHAEENFPEIHYWRRKEFLTDDVIDLDSDTEKVGKLGFLEHVNGIRFTAEELKSVRKHAYESFADLLEDGIAPQKWSQASSTATQRVRHAIISHHPEISLCADNWKVDAVVTETYGQWTTRRKEQIAASSQRRQQVKESTTKSRSSKRKHEGGADDAGSSKRSKQHGEAERSGVMNKSKERKKKRKHKQDDPDLPPRSVSPPASNNAEIDMDMGLDSDFDLGRDLDLDYDVDEDDAPVNEKNLSKLLDDDDTSGRSPGSSSHETRLGITSFATPPPLNGPEDADSVAGSPEPSPAKPKKITLSNPLLRAKAKGGAKGKGKEAAASADVTNPPVTAAPPASTSPTIPPALNKATAAPTDLANSTAAASGSSSAPTFASASPSTAEDPSTNLSTPAVPAAAAGKPKKAKSEKLYKPGEPDTAWNLWTREYQKTHSATGKELHEIWDTMDKTKYQVAAAAAKEKKKQESGEPQAISTKGTAQKSGATREG
ncbi:hypothetical protein C8R47DRAFT_1328050 [Mycena vitilis]|nr:hypothetical protein C8R47DRAFT_1328050 [Mycena vitilis]